MVHGITATTTNTSSQPITTSVTSEEIDATVTMSNYKMIQDEADSVKVSDISLKFNQSFSYAFSSQWEIIFYDAFTNKASKSLVFLVIK